MNTVSGFANYEAWHIAGWTMIHFLWLGAAIAIAAFVCRLMLRRATPNARYAVALGWLCILAAAPIGIATWVASDLLLMQAESSLPQSSEIEGFVGATDQEVDAAQVQPQVIELSEQNDVTSAPEFDAPQEAGSMPQLESEPSPNPSLKGRGISVAALEKCVPYLPWLWIVGTPITFALLAVGIVGSKRLRLASTPLVDDPIVELMDRLAHSLRITKRVGLAVCDRIAAPVLIGIVRPMILLPPAALTGWSPDEIEMVLLHELAHVRRWDNLVNLMQRIIESLLFFHPAVWMLSTWVRREREACCDAVVVGRTRRPHAYAEMLVALAAQMPRSVLFYPAASSAMAAGPLRNRIRRILQLEDDPMLISGKSFTLVLAALVTAAALAVLYVPKIGQADEPATEVTENTERTNPPRGETTSAGQIEVLPEKAQTAGLEKALQDKISLIVVLFNDTGEYRRHLRPVYEKLAREGKTIYLFGINIDDASNEAKRYGVGPGPTLVIFRQGTESDRLENIKNAEQLNEFVASKLGRTEKSKGKFPSFEDQKLADLALRYLQIELEPIDENELQQVKAMNYEGGLRVTQSPGIGSKGLLPGDILVGLGVWPTKNLKEVGEILKRDDLYEMNPLKFYAVRAQGGTPEMPESPHMLATGRLPVKFDNWPRTSPRAKAAKAAEAPVANASTSPAKVVAPVPTPTPTAPSSAPIGTAAPRVEQNPYGSVQLDAKHPVAGSKSALRYDGKTFDEWRDLWRNELSVEKRHEAVKALAAFGANGYGSEAAEAIVEVAGQYDWDKIGGHPATESLERACIDAFGGSYGTLANSLPEKDALAVLLENVANENKSTKKFVAWSLGDHARDNAPAMEALATLSRDEDEQIRKAAWKSITRTFTPSSAPARTRVHEALTGKDPVAQQQALDVIARYAEVSLNKRRKADKLPELNRIAELLLSDEVEVRQQARRVLRVMSNDEASAVVKAMLVILRDENLTDVHIEAIRALGVLGARAQEAKEDLMKFLASENESERIAAATALSGMLEQAEWNKALVKEFAEFGLRHQADGAFLQLPGSPENQKYYDFQNAINAERKIYLP